MAEKNLEIKEKNVEIKEAREYRYELRKAFTKALEEENMELKEAREEFKNELEKKNKEIRLGKWRTAC